MLNVLIAILEYKDVVSKKEAEKLAEGLKFATLTDKYADAKRLIETILK